MSMAEVKTQKVETDHTGMKFLQDSKLGWS
jgi:hypothetical protein